MGPRTKSSSVWGKTLSLKQDKEELFKELESFGPKFVMILAGDLGAGKTTFVRELVASRSQGKPVEAASPTFALHNRYQIKISEGEIALDHLDLYRLEDEDDLETTGFWDLFTEQRGWILIEWGDRLDPSILPHNWPLYEMKITGAGGSRSYEIFRWE